MLLIREQAPLEGFPKAGMFLSLILGVLGFSLSHQWYWLLVTPVWMIGYAGLQKPSMVFYLLLFSLPLSVEWQWTQSLGTDLPDEVLMWAMTGLVMLSVLLRPGFWVRGKADQPLKAFLILHLAWIFFTAVQSPNLLLSFKFLAAKIWYIMAFAAGSWWFLRDGKSLRKAAWSLVIPMTIAVLVVLYNQVRIGFDFDAVNAAVKPFFRNHVNYAAILVCLLPIPVAMAVLHPRASAGWILLAGLWCIALVFSYSRGAWVAVIIALLACVLLRFRKLTGAVAFAFLLCLGLVWFFFQGNRYLNHRPNFDQTIYHQDFSDHLEATYRLKDLSTVERFHRWIAGLRMVADKPVLGHGPNRFYEAYRPYTVNAFRTYVSDNPEHSTVHNYFLLLAVEQGLPGLFFFLLILFRMFRIIQVGYHGTERRREKVFWMLMAAVLSMITWLNMLSDLVEADKVGSLFFICVGLCLGADRWKTMGGASME